MNVVKTWGISVGSACILCAIVSYLKPHMRFEKVMKLSLSAFLIVALISPFLGGNIKLSSVLPSEELAQEYRQKGESKLLEYSINAAQQAAKEEIAACLQKHGIDFEEIVISMNIDESENILINEIGISGVSQSQRQRAHDTIKKELNLEAAVK